MKVNNTLVSVENLYKEFALSVGLLEELQFERGRLVRKRSSVKAINGVDLAIERGEALCLVGESGCGKSTVARIIMGLLSLSSGQI
ncbi:MAG: ATP-binding cassette domain-containing protein, partial [Gammaproteobacteria bacterium]